MTRSVVDVADLNTGARIHPSSSAELCGRGTKMGSWQKLSLPGDQRCISGSPAASFGNKDILRMSCTATARSAEFPLPGCSCEILPLGLQTQPLHCYRKCLILVLENLTLGAVSTCGAPHLLAWATRLLWKNACRCGRPTRYGAMLGISKDCLSVRMDVFTCMHNLTSEEAA